MLVFFVLFIFICNMSNRPNDSYGSNFAVQKWSPNRLFNKTQLLSSFQSLLILLFIPIWRMDGSVTVSILFTLFKCLDASIDSIYVIRVIIFAFFCISLTQQLTRFVIKSIVTKYSLSIFFSVVLLGCIRFVSR